MSAAPETTHTSSSNPVLRVWEHIKNEPGLLRNVLVVAGLVLLSVIVGGYILSQARANWPWSDEVHYTATFVTAPALSPGNGQEVRIAGVKVGEIRDAAVDAQGRAELDLALDPQYAIYEDAKLVLRPKSPLNEMYIELSPGGPPARKLQDGDRIPASASVAPVEVDEVFGNLDANTQSALSTLMAESDTALANSPQTLPPGLNATDALVNRLKPLAQGLQTRRDLIARLVHSLGVIVQTAGKNDQRLADLATSLQKTLTSTGDQNQALDASLAQLPEVTDRLREATGGVQSLSAQLDPTLDHLKDASSTLPDSLSRTTDTIDRLGEFVDKAAPVLDKAKPVLADLRPLVGDVNGSLPDLKKSTGRLDQLTSYSVPYLTDLQAFVWNTTSAYSLKDAQGGILRGMQQYSPETLTGLRGVVAQHPELVVPPGGAGPQAPLPPALPLPAPVVAPQPSK